MNEQQLAAVKQAVESMTDADRLLEDEGYGRAYQQDAITALQSIISQDALDKMAEDARTIGLRLDDWDKIGCVNHDCDKCKAVQEPVAWVPYLSDRADGVQGHYAIARWNPRGYREVWNLRRHAWGAFSDDVMSLEEADYLLQQITIPTRKPTPPAAQPAPVQDAEGENKAVRFFLMLYGQPGLTVGQMKGHMRMSGFKMWPAWADTEPDGAHLTKAGAQLWIRHLFALEPTAPQPVPVKTYHDGKPWPVQPKPWVGLTDEEAQWIYDNGRTPSGMMEMVEAKLKEKNT
jgi:hypothetical protein